MEKEIIIGVDLGGTKIMTGAIDQQGNVIGTPVKVATEGTRPKEVILDKIMASIRQVLRDNNLDPARLRGIGVGSTGPLDSDKGLILECPQLPTLHFFPLRDALSREFGLPVALNNDANCLILARLASEPAAVSSALQASRSARASGVHSYSMGRYGTEQRERPAKSGVRPTQTASSRTSSQGMASPTSTVLFRKKRHLRSMYSGLPSRATKRL